MNYKLLTISALVGLMMTACCYRHHHDHMVADASSVQGTQAPVVVLG